MRVEGLETLDYLDNLKNRQRFTEQGDAITFESEVSVCSLVYVIEVGVAIPYSIHNTCILLFPHSTLTD